MKLKLLPTIIIILQITLQNKTDVKFRNLCLSIPQFEGLHPEYAQKTLDQRFETEKIIGKGSFGRLILGSLKDKEIVIKRVKVNEPIFIKLVSKEIEILEKLKEHPHVFHYHFCVFDEEKRLLYMLTESLYKDLNQVDSELRSKTRSERLAFYLKIAKSLKEIHLLKIVHEDLKPQNIMVTDKTLKIPKLIDFGLSAYIDEEIVGGSPLYVGQERLTASTNYADPKNDIASFGVTICVLEIGLDRVKTFMKKKKNEQKSMKWFHDSIAEQVDDFYYDLPHPNIFENIFTFFKGLFMDVKKDKVFNFQKYLNGLMEDDIEERLDDDANIFILERFLNFYQKLDRKNDKKKFMIV